MQHYSESQVNDTIALYNSEEDDIIIVQPTGSGKSVLHRASITES